MDKFILLADRRSGTTLVIDCLTGHPGITCAKRAFGQEKKIRNPTENHHSSDFYLYRTGSLSNRCKYFLHKKQLIKTFLDENIYAPRPGIRAAGFRLIYDMVGIFPELVEIANEENIKVLHLIRENVLKTYVSSVTARIHKMHHPREGDRVQSVKVHLDPAKMLQSMKTRTQRIEAMRARFSTCPYMETTYEEFTANRDSETARILPFLGIDDMRELHSDLVKINPDSLEDIIENYAEIQDTLSGTPYEIYLR